MEEARPCEFRDLCEKCHPEKDMKARRESCDDERCRKCGVYWAFKDGYYGIDEE